MKNEQNTEDLNEQAADQTSATAENTEEQEETLVEDQQKEQEEQDEVAENETETDELAEMKGKYVRLYSEFDNFRKRTNKEKLALIESANESLLKELLPVLDDFDRAAASAEGEEGPLKEGFDLIYNKFKKVVENSGLTVMVIDQGTDFDADFHEAISQIPAPDEKLKGKIIDVVEKGYMLKEKVVRFAKVVVGS